MGRYGPASVGFLLIGGMNVRSRVATIRIKTMTETEETRPLGESWEQHTPIGLHRGELEQTGWYDDALRGLNQGLIDLEGTPQVVCVAPSGNVALAQMVGYEGVFAASWERVVERRGLTKANVTYAIDGQVDEGRIVQPLTAVDGSASAAVDFGAGSTQGGAVYAQLEALTLGGYTDVGLTVEHSVDDVTYADLVTWTGQTAAPTAVRLPVTGTINRYVKTTWAFAGTGSGQSLTAMVALARG